MGLLLTELVIPSSGRIRQLLQARGKCPKDECGSRDNHSTNQIVAGEGMIQPARANISHSGFGLRDRGRATTSTTPHLNWGLSLPKSVMTHSNL